VNKYSIRAYWDGCQGQDRLSESSGYLNDVRML